MTVNRHINAKDKKELEAQLKKHYPEGVLYISNRGDKLHFFVPSAPRCAGEVMWQEQKKLVLICFTRFDPSNSIDWERAVRATSVLQMATPPNKAKATKGVSSTRSSV